MERIFQTLQSRLPIELRLAGATSIEQANEFLASYLQEYNARFALSVNGIKSVFEKQPEEEQINQMLAVIAERKVDSGHCLRFENTFFKPVDSNGNPVYYYKGTSALVIKSFDGRKYATINEKVYELDEIPLHEHKSRNFNFYEVKEEPRKRYIPPMSHPWKQGTFSSFVKKERHKYNYSFEDVMNSQASSY